MRKDIDHILYDEATIASKVRELGALITKDYEGKEPFLVGVLKGCFVFMSDLSKEIDLYCDIDFMAVSSYGSGTTTTGAVQIKKDLSRDIEGRDVIIIEDILDSGVTLSYLTKYLENRKPASIKICTLMDKPARRQTDIKADYVGFVCPDEFVVGYGLDYDEKYRNLPFIGVLKPEIYE
ncbi:MAG: hypoxanthine phosphoribosyltransferase [Oscillospiraceae bacterium]|nr:hypoxanthine phosphoribosyltransferase [Oscillospiraceae bacterium]